MDKRNGDMHQAARRVERNVNWQSDTFNWQKSGVIMH
jgi:hypothetical protein